jgi:hypothetical protein
MHTCPTPLEHLTAFAVVFSLGLLCAVAVDHCRRQAQRPCA